MTLMVSCAPGSRPELSRLLPAASSQRTPARSCHPVGLQAAREQPEEGDDLAATRPVRCQIRPAARTASVTGMSPLTGFSVKPAVSGESSSAATTAATSSRGTAPDALATVRRTIPLPESSVSRPGRSTVQSRPARERTAPSAAPFARRQAVRTVSSLSGLERPLPSTTRRGTGEPQPAPPRQR